MPDQAARAETRCPGESPSSPLQLARPKRCFHLFAGGKAVQEFFDGAVHEPIHRDIAHLGVLLKPLVEILRKSHCCRNSTT